MRKGKGYKQKVCSSIQMCVCVRVQLPQAIFGQIHHALTAHDAVSSGKLHQLKINLNNKRIHYKMHSSQFLSFASTPSHSLARCTAMRNVFSHRAALYVHNPRMI